MTAVRIAHDVAAELRRRRLDGEANYNGVIRRALEERELEAKLEAGGLTTDEMATLSWLRSVKERRGR